MRTVKLFGRVFAVIFSCLFACFLLLVMYVLVAKAMLTEGNIYNSIVDTGFFTNYNGNSEKSDLRQSIVNDLKKCDIPVSVTEKVLESDDVNRVLSDYIYDYTRYVLYNKGTSGFSSDVIISDFDKEYKNSTGKNLNNNQIMFLNRYISSTEYKLSSSVPSLGDLQNKGISIYKVRLISNFVSSDYMWLVAGIFIISFYTLIAICLWSKLRAFKWVGFINIIVGLLLIISSFLEVRLLGMFVSNNGIFENLAITMASKNFEFLLIAGIVLIALGILFLIICALLMKKEHKVDSDKLLDFVIKDGVSSSNVEDLDDIASKDVSNQVEVSDSSVNDNVIFPKKEYTNDIDQVLLDDIFDDSPDSVIDVTFSDDIPIVKINGNDNEEIVNSNIEAVCLDEDSEYEIDNTNANTLDDNEDKVEIDIPSDEDSIVVVDDTSDIEDDKVDEDVSSPEQVVISDIGDSVDNDVSDVEEDNTEYEEIDDFDSKIERSEINILKPENVSLSVITPKKGKDIEPDLVEVLNDDEEDVELL